MKYLLISDEYRPFIGGIARVAGALSDGLIRRGHQVTVLTNAARVGDRSVQREQAEMKYYRQSMTGPLRNLYFAGVWPFPTGAWIRRGGFDRVLVLDPANALPIPIMSLFGRIHYELLLYGSELIRYSRGRSTRLLFRQSLAGAARLFSITGFVARELRERFGFSSQVACCGVGDNFLSEPVDSNAQQDLRHRLWFQRF